MWMLYIEYLNLMPIQLLKVNIMTPDISVVLTGADCDSRCNIYCFNGAALDESNCTCQCKEHQTGSYCKCETGYTGKDCTEKKSE